MVVDEESSNYEVINFWHDITCKLAFLRISIYILAFISTVAVISWTPPHTMQPQSIDPQSESYITSSPPLTIPPGNYPPVNTIDTQMEPEIGTSKDNRIIHFLHIHKSGGTAVCRLAGKNMNSFELETSGNCNVQPDQQCCGDEDTMEAQARFAKKTRYKFVATEKYMYESMDPHYYRYVLTLRTSIERYASHYLHLERNGAFQKNKRTFYQWIAGQPDNWNMRHICGMMCMDVPKFSLNETHWNHTLARLGLFENILFMSDSNSSLFDDSYNRFACDVGWNELKPLTNPKKLNGKPDGQQKDYYDILKNHNGWDERTTLLDDILYQYALALYQGKVSEVAVDFTKMKNEEVACTDPCCGPCTEYRL